jgi:hypothetical protein
MGGRSHPPTLPHTGVVALAGRSQFVERDRLPAPRILSRLLDVGNPSHRRQENARRWYLSFNPTLDRSFHGTWRDPGRSVLLHFQVSYDFTKRILAGWSITVRGDRSRTSVHSTISNSSSFLPLRSIWVQSRSSTLAWASAQPLPPIKCIIRRRFS